MSPGYQRVALVGKDIIAGLVVFLIALPLCLGIALASGAPIVSGLLAGIIGGIVVGAISGSAVSVSGPAAGLTAIIGVQILSLGSFDSFLAALVIAGLLQIVLGLLRLGFVADFFPTSVIKGMLSAIGLMLILKQLPHLVGLDQDFEGDMALQPFAHQAGFSSYFDMFNFVHPGAVTIGVLSLAVMLLWNRTPSTKRECLPAPLIVVVLGLLMTYVLSQLNLPAWEIDADHRVLVPVISSIFDFTALFTGPAWDRMGDRAIWVSGISLAVVASLETLLNVEAADKIDPVQRKTPPNRELLAQGVGNVLLGFIGGLPTTSVIVRSSVNINAGARTKLSTISHGIFLLVCVVLLPGALNHIPLSCLAAILIVTGFKLANPKIVTEMWSQGLDQFLPFAATFFAILFTDLLIGVVFGLAVSLLFILKRNVNAPIRLTKERHVNGDLRRVTLGNQVSFLNRASLTKVLTELPNNSHVVIDATDTDYIDADVLDLINDYQRESAKVRRIDVSLVGFKNHYSLVPSQFVDHTTVEAQRTISPSKRWRCSRPAMNVCALINASNAISTNKSLLLPWASFPLQ